MTWVRISTIILLCALTLPITSSAPILWSYSIEGITALSVSENGDYIAVGCEDGWYYIFDTWGNKIGSGHVSDAVVSLDIADTGDFIVGFSDKYTFCTVDGAQLSTVEFYHVRSVSISSDGNFSLACCENYVLFNVGTSIVRQTEVSSEFPFGAISSDGTVACAVSDADLIIFEILEDRIDMWSHEAGEKIKHLFVSPEGENIVFSTNTEIGYITVRSREGIIVDIDPSMETGPLIRNMATTPMGDMTIVATNTRLIWLKGESLIGELAIDGYTKALSLTDDGSLTIVGEEEGTIQIITVDGSTLFTYDFESPILTLEMSRENDLLAVCTEDSIYTFQLFQKIQPNTHYIPIASRRSLPLISPLEEVWSIPVTENAYFLTGDIDGDGFTDILLNEGTKLKLIDGDGNTKSVRDLKSTFGVYSLLDVDGDILPDIPLIFSATRFKFSIYDWMEDTVRDYYLGSLGGDTWLHAAEVMPIAVIDSDSDGNPEILASFGVGYSCKPRGMICIDYASGEIKWFYQRGTTPLSHAVADINGDGIVEIVLGSMAPCTCPDDEEYPDCEGYVTVLSITGEELWEVNMGHGFKRISVAVADVHEREGIEIVEFGCDASENWGNLCILSCTGEYLYKYEFDYSIVPGAVGDIDNDGEKEIVAADTRGSITVYTGDLQVKSTEFITDDMNANTKLYLNDFNGDGFLEIFLILEKELFIFDKDFNVLWKKEFPEKVWPVCNIANFFQCKNTLLIVSDKLYAYSYTTEDSPCPLWEITERTLREEGETYLEMAESAFLTGEYTTSRSYYENALERFEKLEYEETEASISEKTKEVSTIIYKYNIRTGIIFLIICGAGLCMVLLYYWFFRRWSRLAEGALLLILPVLLALYQVHSADKEYLQVFVTYFVPSLIIATIIVSRQSFITFLIILEQNILNFYVLLKHARQRRIDSIDSRMLAFIEISPNPYNISKPIISKNMFFGRQDIIDYVTSHISKRGLDNILVIHGERRIGKTSLLYQLREYHLFQDHIPVYINMQAITDEGTDVFFYNLSEFIIDALEKAGYTIERPRLEDFQKAPTTYFNRKTLRVVAEKLKDRKLVLMFDEFEELHKRVEDGKIDQDALSFLRSVMLENNRIVFIFVGTHQLAEIMGQYWSVLFNIALHKKMDTLSRKDTFNLVAKPVERYNMGYQDNAKEYIFQITGGHPYFIQLVCLELVDYHNSTMKSRIEIGDIDIILEKILERGYYHFRFVWEQSEKDEKIFLVALAELENASKESTNKALLSNIKKHLPHYTLERLLDTADNLLWREVIIRDKDKGFYKFKIDIIRMWISQYRKLYEIIEEVKE
jgi:hypothetical protein